jgi:hypothetical protein
VPGLNGITAKRDPSFQDDNASGSLNEGSMAHLHPLSSKTCEHITPHAPALPLIQLFFRLVLVETSGRVSNYAFPHLNGTLAPPTELRSFAVASE